MVEDESFFVYDSLVRKTWALKGSKPVVLTTGSHALAAWFGALASDGTQLFRQYAKANSGNFMSFMDELRAKYPRAILFLDKATYHRKEKRVQAYLRAHRATVRVHWFPSGFPESNPVEECWNQAKGDVLGSTFYESFGAFKDSARTYFRTKRFKLNLYNYLCP